MKLRLCTTCRRLFPPGTVGCPEHGSVLREDPLLGTVLSGYQVAACLGDGLYLALQPASAAQAGVRVLPVTVSQDLPVALLLDELRRASTATAGIAPAPVEGGVLPDGRYYYLFPWAHKEGMEALGSRLLDAPRPPAEALEVALALCNAVEAAHKAGLCHGALGGETVLLRQPAGAALRAQLLDLGLLRRLPQLRAVSGVKGDPAQARRAGTDPEDPRVDIYAIGALLYQLATGAPLHSAVAFSGTGADLAPQFQAVVLRALAQHREDRHPSVAALREDLLGLLGETRGVKLPEAGGPLGSANSNPAWLWALTIGLLLVAVTMGGLLLFRLHAQGMLFPRRQGTAPAASSNGDGRPVPEPRRELPAAPLGADGWLVPLSLRVQALGVLAEAQHSPSAELRRQAAQLIRQSGDPRLRPQAEALLGDRDAGVAAQAAWALGQLADRAAVVTLGQAAGDMRITLPVGVALLQLGDVRGLELLRTVLRGKDDDERLEAALWLGEHGEPEAWRVLRRFLTQSHEESPLRYLHILGRLCRGRDQAACQQMRERLGPRGRAPTAGPGPSAQVRMLIGEGLLQAGDILGYKVLHEVGQDPALRLPALRLLAEGGLDAVEERWLLALVSQEPAGQTEGQLKGRAQAAEALGRSASVAVVPVLGALLGPGAPPLRHAAAGALLRLSALEPRSLQAQAVDWAQGALSEPRGLSRATAAAVLGLAPPALAIPLLERALGDREAETRTAAVQALGRLRDAAALPVLRRALGDREAAVRVAALQALGRVGGPEAEALLREYLGRGSLLEQVAVAGVRLQNGDPGHRFVLQQALRAPDPALRRLAFEQARHDPDPEQRRALWLQGLSDAADEVQQLCAVALAHIGDRRGVDVLRAQGVLLAQRLLSRDALERLKEPVPTLDVAAALGAAGEGQRAAAMTVARELLPETGLALVLRGLRDASPVVRLRAVEAAAELPEERRQRQQLVLQLSRDPDPTVQARTLSLLAHLLAPGAG